MPKRRIKFLIAVSILFVVFTILFSLKNNEKEIDNKQYEEKNIVGNSIDNKLEESKERIEKKNLLQKEKEVEDGITIDNFLSNIKELNHLAIEFKEQNECNDTITQLCLQYIRKDKYNSTAWNLVAGNINKQFIEFVKQNSKKLSSYKFQNTRILDSNVDFIHMCATLNAILYENSLLPIEYSGWAGDLVTLMGQVIKFDKDVKIDSDELIKYSENLLGANNINTKFDLQDMYADIDAVNIAQMDTQSFYSSIIEYYYKENDIRKNREKVFVSYICNQENTESIYEAVRNNLKRNSINVNFLLMNTYGYNIALQYRENSGKYIEILSKVFDNYFKGYY